MRKFMAAWKDCKDASAIVQVSMSSTSIVVKCLADTKSSNSPHGQITIGTLILQVRVLRSLTKAHQVLQMSTSNDPIQAINLHLHKRPSSCEVQKNARRWVGVLCCSGCSCVLRKYSKDFHFSNVDTRQLGTNQIYSCGSICHDVWNGMALKGLTFASWASIHVTGYSVLPVLMLTSCPVRLCGRTAEFHKPLQCV